MQTSASFFFYPDSDPDQSQHLMGSKLDRDPSSDFFSMKFQPVVSAYYFLLTNGHENNTSLVEVINNVSFISVS